MRPLPLSRCSIRSSVTGRGAWNLENPATRNLLFAPEAWRIVTAEPFASHGAARVAAGILTLETGKPGTGASYRGPVPRIDYTISAEAQRTKGDDFFYGLTFPIHDQHASLIIGGWGGGVTGISNLNGNSAVENETTAYTPFENNRWYAIELVVTSQQITAAIDGRRILAIETAKYQYEVWPQQAVMIPLGIATWKTSAEIRNLKLHTHTK